MNHTPRHSGRPLPAAQGTASVGAPRPIEPTNVRSTPVALVLLGVTLVLAWALFRSTRTSRKEESRITNVLEDNLGESELAWMKGKGIQWPLRRSWRDYRLATACAVVIGGLGLLLFLELRLASLRAGIPMLVLAVEGLALLLACTLFVRHVIRVARVWRIHSEIRGWGLTGIPRRDSPQVDPPTFDC